VSRVQDFAGVMRRLRREEERREDDQK